MCAFVGVGKTPGIDTNQQLSGEMRKKHFSSVFVVTDCDSHRGKPDVGGKVFFVQRVSESGCCIVIEGRPAWFGTILQGY